MRGLALDFTGNGAVLSLSSQVEGRAADVQAVLVNVVTESGSDPAYPDRGTNLRRSLRNGGPAGWVEAAHAANFAALATLAFMGRFASGDVALSGIDIKVESMAGDLVEFNTVVSFADGTVAGALEGAVI
jgi:hypothetical protein